ncbi:MAG: hypothetical protein RR396_04360 [Clostridiales bacterium]
MKNLILKCRAVLNNQHGETIVESVVSLCIFSLLMLTVTMIINSSIQIINTSLEKSSNYQQSLNNVVLGSDLSAQSRPIIITIAGADPGSSITPTEQKVDLYENDYLLWFEPGN